MVSTSNTRPSSEGARDRMQINEIRKIVTSLIKYTHDLNPSITINKSLSLENHSFEHFDIEITKSHTTCLAEILPKSDHSSPIKTPTSKDNSRKEPLDFPNITINLVSNPADHMVPSTGCTDNYLHLRGRDSISNSETRRHEKRAKSAQSTVDKHAAVNSLRIKSMPEVPTSENHLDEFSELVVVSPFGDADNEEDHATSPKKPRNGNFLIIQTKPLTPYLSNVRASPFTKGGQGSAKSAQIVNSGDKLGLSTFLPEDKKPGTSRNAPREKVFNDLIILNKLCDLLEYGDISCLQYALPIYNKEKKYKDLFKARLQQLFQQKPSEKEQHLFWDSFLNFQKLYQEHPNSWSRQSTRSCQVVEDICKDLDRTLPEYEMFQTEEGRNPLLKVLIAISNIYPEMGYVQGLNSIVGVTLFYLKEEESFWLILYLFEKMKVKKIFYPNFEGLALLNYQLEVFLENYLPNIWKMFKDAKMDISYYTYSWFITLFADNVKVANAIKIWNYVFTRGFSFLIQFALALFSTYKDEILSMDIDEVGPFLKEKLRDLDENEENIFAHALTFKVSERLILELEKIYAAGKTPVQVITSPGKKTYLGPISKSSQSPVPTATENKPNERASNWPQQKLKPFFKTVINTITIDFPDTLKHLFKKSPSKTQPPMAFTHAGTPHGENQDTEKKDSLLVEDTLGYNQRAFDTLQPSEVVGEVSKESSSLEDERRENMDDDLLTGRQNFGNILSSSIMEPNNINTGIAQKRSITTRSRKRMPTGVPSKQINDPQDHKVDRENNEILEETVLSNQQSLLEIKWDEFPALKMDGESKSLPARVTNEEMVAESFASRMRQSLESNGPGTSETDCTNIDEEVSTSLGNISARRGINDYILANQSRSCPERKV